MGGSFENRIFKGVIRYYTQKAKALAKDLRAEPDTDLEDQFARAVGFITYCHGDTRGLMQLIPQDRMTAELKFNFGISMLLAGDLRRGKRYVGPMNDTVFKKDGVWLFYSDWGDLLFCFEDGNRSNYRSTAEEVFNGDFSYDSGYSPPWKDGFAYHRLSAESLNLLRQKLIGRVVADDDSEEGERPLTGDDVVGATQNDIENWIDNDSCDDIQDAISSAVSRTGDEGVENAYYKACTDAVEEAMGTKGVYDKKSSKLGFFITYRSLSEFLAKYYELNSEYFSGNFHDLLEHAVEKQSLPDNIDGDFDDETFNYQIDFYVDQIDDIDVDEAPAPDPNQTELPMDVPVKPRDEKVVYAVYNADYPKGATIHGSRSGRDQLFKEHPEYASEKAWQEFVLSRRKNSRSKKLIKNEA